MAHGRPEALPPRSLAEDLRGRTDAQLAELLLHRPDLGTPPPEDLTALATRAATPASVALCLAGYDQVLLHAATAAALLPGPITSEDLTAAFAARLPEIDVIPDSSGPVPVPEHVAAPTARRRAAAAVARLRREAILWGEDSSLHLLGAARDLLCPPHRGPAISALDDQVAAFAREPQVLRTLVAAGPPAVRSALDLLLSGSVLGAVANARRRPDPSRTPIDWLLAHHLLVPLGDDLVGMPAEVVAILRGDAVTVPSLAPPRPPRLSADSAALGRGSAAAALETLNRVAELGHLWTQAPAGRVRTGALTQKDFAQVSAALGVGSDAAALLVEVSVASGLMGTDGRPGGALLPTLAFDAWLRQPLAQRYARLAAAWLSMPRTVPAPSGRPLAPDALAPELPRLRQRVLSVLAGGGSWDVESLGAAIRWWAPRVPAGVPDGLGAILDQATVLGLVVAGSLTRAGAAALGDEPASAIADAIQPDLPAPVDSLILQADLTAIVPGPPTPQLAAVIRAMADPESLGAASVYRFSTGSIRRALDAGNPADELLAELRRRAPIPQALAYLIEEVAARHAALRIGAVATYLRCDDPTLLTAILADPRAAGLGLFRLGEGVLGSQQPPDLVAAGLQQAGHWPQPDPARGHTAPAPRRSRGTGGIPELSAGPGSLRGISPGHARSVVARMRSADPPEGRAPARS